MEQTDRDRILGLAEHNFRMRKLYEEHEYLEEKLLVYQKRPFLTRMEELEEKRLKLQKLRGVDEMMRILFHEDQRTVSEALSA